MRLDRKSGERRQCKVIGLPKLNEHEYSNILYLVLCTGIPVYQGTRYTSWLELFSGGRQYFSFEALSW